jgi:hypothetical protein
MLIGLALGGVPSNFTTPLRAAVPPVMAAGPAPSAFTIRRVEIQTVNSRAITRRKPFIVQLLKANLRSLIIS